MDSFCKNTFRGLLGLCAIIFVLMINIQAQAAMTLVYDGQTHIYNAQPITININGKNLSNLPMPPVIIDDFTLVPVKEVFTALGAVVEWKSETQEVYVGLNGNMMILKINSKEVNLNSSIYSMNIPPKIINDKTMVPLRFPLEAFGYIVKWNQVARMITIEAPSTIEIPTSVISTPPVVAVVPTPIPMPTPVPTPLPVVTVPPTMAPATNPLPLGSGTSEEAYENMLNLPSQPIDVGTKASDMSPYDITVMKYPETVITKVNIPVNLSESFSITAQSEISRVEKLVLDNRLVIDIYDATCWLEPVYELPNNPIVAGIRTAQNQVTPVKITRIVFDLNISAGFSLTISNDRKTLYLSFERNNVLGVMFSRAGDIDRVTVICEKPPGFDDFPLTSPDRLVIDVQLATLKQPVNQTISGKYVKMIRAEQFDTTTTRIVLDLNEIVKYNVKVIDNTIIIELSEMTIKNIIYLADQGTIKIKKNPNFPINISNIGHTDNYNEYTYILNLKSDYKGYLGDGEYVIKNAYFYSIVVKNNAVNQTEIHFNENQIFAYDIYEDAEFITVKFMNPKEKYRKVVVLDAGHGDGDWGTFDDAKTLIEKDVVLDMVLRTMKLFEGNNDIKIYATRQTDVYVERSDRANMANQIADAFISVHVNSSPNGYDTGPNGTEVHYYTHSNDATIGISTKEFAEICQKNMLAALGSNDRKTKRTNFQVLRETTVPSVLIETGFRTNPGEMAKLKTPEYRQKVAIGVYNSILELFAKYTPKR